MNGIQNYEAANYQVGFRARANKVIIESAAKTVRESGWDLLHQDIMRHIGKKNLSKKIYLSNMYRQQAKTLGLKLPKYLTIEEFYKIGNTYPTMSQCVEANVLKMTDWECIKELIKSLLKAK